MLEPSKLQTIPDELVKYYEDLETELLKDIAKRLSETDFILTNRTRYEARKLKELGVHYDEVVRKIAEALKVSKEKVKKVITQNVYDGVMDDIRTAEKYDIMMGEGFDKGILKEHMTSAIKSLNGELTNITRSLAAAASKEYEKVLDDAYMKVNSGAYSYQEAINTGVDDLTKNGMETFTYKSGHTDRISTVVRRAVLSGVNAATIRAQLETLSSMGMRLVHTTQHLGARPTHEVWQGKTFYIGDEPVEGYQSLEEGTGYGTGDGLGGWNCRHGIRIALEELGLDYTEEPIDTEENNRIYELEQQQRYNERKIREWKRKVEIKKAAGMDYGYELNYLKKWQETQENHIKEHPELKRQENREAIYKNESAKEIANRNELEDDGLDIPSFVNKSNSEKLNPVNNSDEIVDKYFSKLKFKTQNPVIRDLIKKDMKIMPERDLKFLLKTRIKIEESDGNNSYSGWLIFNQIKINPKKTIDGSFAHEFAHCVSRVTSLYTKKDFMKLLNNVLDNGMIGDSFISNKNGEKIEYVRFISDYFVKPYQGRTYIKMKNVKDLKKLKLKPEDLKEYVSVGYQTYITDPNGLYVKDKMLYDYFEKRGLYGKEKG